MAASNYDSRKRSRNDEDQEQTPSKKQILEGGSALDSILLPNKALLPAADNEDFRVITGTYERILYGINAYWEKNADDDNGSAYKIRMEPVFIVPAHIGCIRTVAIGGHFLASGSTDEIIRLYDVKKRKEYGSLGGQHTGDITDIQFHGKYMLTGSEDKMICLWRTKDWEYLKTLKGHKGKVNSIAIHPSGKIALSVSSDKTVIVWNLMTAKKASMNKVGQEGLCVLWNNEGDKYAIMFDRSVNIYTVSDASVSTTISHHSRFLCMRYYTSRKKDKSYIVTGHEDRTARVWDAETGDCVAELAGHKLRVKTLSIMVSKPQSSKESIPVLITVSSDGVIKCWDLEAALDKKQVVLGGYNTKSRVTCCTSHIGFHSSADSSEKDADAKAT
ncbi:hypothetical protein VTP01DRAFT_5307 [Rhizomucor pusillus]|uniref:uncharacterized protein n=1 Tax=Rhizomucor pusillus TaxID=4840 RepID=UPI0037434507